MKQSKRYFSACEMLLWGMSVVLIITSFCIFDGRNMLTLIASLIGVTSLIFCAKGNPIGQVLMIIFGLIYGYISFRSSYYGEVFTYVGMTVPMAIFSLVAWLKNPYKSSRSEVAVGHIYPRDILKLIIYTALVTAVFYFILKWTATARLTVSTLSVSTSFIAAYLTFKRVPAFALAYALNDIVLIVLWSLSISSDVSAISVVICFCAFLANDLYGYFSWEKMKKRQKT